MPVGLNNVIAISTLGYNCMALRSDGRIFIWGDNTFGQCNVPTNIVSAKAIYSNGESSFAIRSDGKVFGWGYNWDGAISVPNDLTNAIALSYCVVIKENGSLTFWGPCNEGRCVSPIGLPPIIMISSRSQALALSEIAISFPPTLNIGMVPAITPIGGVGNNY